LFTVCSANAIHLLSSNHSVTHEYTVTFCTPYATPMSTRPQYMMARLDAETPNAKMLCPHSRHMHDTSMVRYRFMHLSR